LKDSVLNYIGSISSGVVSVEDNIDGLEFTGPANAPVLSIAGTPTAGQFLAHDGTWQTPIGEEYTFENGLTESAGTVKLGGDLNGKTTISGTDSLIIATPLAITSGTPGAGKVLTSNATGGATWQNAAPQVKALEIDLSQSIGTQSKIFTGTATAASNITIVSIEPQLTGDATMLAAYLKVNASANGSGSTTVDWSVAIENDNIDSARNCTLTKVIISYICTDNAVGALLNTIEIAGR
jgi:hypothetical protein